MIKLAFLLLFLFSLPLSADQNFQGVERERTADFDSEVSSLTNKVRAYPLRIKSMERLATNYPEKTFPLLLEILKDPQEQQSFRYQAARKMMVIDPPRASTIFLEILDNPLEDPFARRIAIAELVEAGESRIKQRISTIIDNPREDPLIRQYALGVYGKEAKVDEPEKIKKLRNLVESKEAVAIRIDSLFILESLKDYGYVLATIQKFLADKTEHEELRKQCAIIAQRWDDKASVPLMARIAVDPAEPIKLRQLVLGILERMGDKLILVSLEAAFKQESNDQIRPLMQEAISAIKKKS